MNDPIFKSSNARALPGHGDVEIVRDNDVGPEVNIVHVIESATNGVVFTSCLFENPNERGRFERVRAFDTNNERI